MPLMIDTVVVFGDSLSDIGKKWVTKSGRMARAFNQMYVSPTGRFSDCRNWTDFMFEQATGLTMVVSSADTSIALSSRHTTLSANSMVPATVPNRFQYANYAEGGACGDTPHSKGPFLGTLKDQVDAFEKDCRTTKLPLGNTLFIIWFGANDLYTAGRSPDEMGEVAKQVARTQRDRLKNLVHELRRQSQWQARVIFCDLARPLTSVRYTLRLKQAEAELRKVGPKDSVEMVVGPQRPKGEMWHGLQALKGASPLQAKAKQYLLLKAQIAETKELERGVLNFNTMLALIARQSGDRVAEVGSCLSEDTLRALVQGNYRLREGASGTRAEHRSALSYQNSTDVAHLTTIDEVHPTDQVYKLIWMEIYEEIKKSDCAFGLLGGVGVATPLSTLSGPQPATRAGFGNVMAELQQGKFKLKRVQHI
jgi:hypothetical protein